MSVSIEIKASPLHPFYNAGGNDLTAIFFVISDVLYHLRFNSCMSSIPAHAAAIVGVTALDDPDLFLTVSRDTVAMWAGTSKSQLGSPIKSCGQKCSEL